MQVDSHRTRGMSTLSIVAVAAAMFICASLAFAGTAHANYFCPSDGTSMRIVGGSRCVHVYHNDYDYIQGGNVATPVEKCVVVKPNSDGSGGNVGGLVSCAVTNITAWIDYTSTGINGYATLINQGNTHTGFHGDFWLF